MQRTKQNPEILPQPVFKSLAAALEITLERHAPKPQVDPDKTWSDRMREIDQLEEPERWDGMS